ncbi:MAG: helix-turn-helix domain-containing protein [Pseudomonadales bacterium]
MSKKERDRVAVITQVIDKRLNQSQAAKQLGITTRQVRRLVKRYRAEGEAGLISSRQGQPSNNRLSEAIRQQAVNFLHAHYADFLG